MEQLYVQIVTRNITCVSCVMKITYCSTNDEITSLLKEVELLISTHFSYSFKVLAVLTKAQLDAVNNTLKELGYNANPILDENGEPVEYDINGLKEKIKMVKEDPTKLADFVMYIMNLW